MVLDPLSALSVAGNVVQFIEFTSSVLSESRKTFQSGAGTSDNNGLESVVEGLLQFSARLKLNLPKNNHGTLPEADNGLFSVLESCEGIANELLEAFQRLKLKDGPHKRWNSFRQALEGVWKREKLLGIQSRLGFLREQITLHIVSSIRWVSNPLVKSFHC